MTITHRSHDMTDKLRETLEQIARQKKTTELETEYDVEVAAFDDGYDMCIDTARAALAAAPQPAPVDREALVELIRVSDPSDMIGTHESTRIADALIAAGLRLPGAQPAPDQAELAALRKVNSELIRENARLTAAMDTPEGGA